MNIEEFREYCLSLKGVREKMPFLNVPDKYSRDVLCFYVAGKWFCFVNIEVFDLLYQMQSGRIRRVTNHVYRNKARMAHE